jgi:hypothetical protein
MNKSVFLLLFVFGLQTHQLWAQESEDENSDLTLIPKVLETTKDEPSPVERPGPSGRVYFEDVLTGWSNRELLVPVPIKSPAWQNRTSLDFNSSWQIDEKVKLNLSNRLNVIEGDTISFPSSGNLRNDFREGFISWETTPRTYLEAGRINLKNGIALGYNPTDFFKSRTTVDMASIDPSAQRENRLGSLMVKGQKIWDNGAVTLAFSPGVTAERPMPTTQSASFDPLFDQTNCNNRFLATFSYDIVGLNPQALVFIDNVGTHFGVNISRVMGASIVTYAEWSGIQEASLTKRAVTYGQNTGSLPQGVPLLPQTDAGTGFQNDLALGLSWTSSFNLTINLEYHFHQAGFGAADFDKWVSLGRTNPRLASELWFIRQYAADQQEPLIQHEIFLRFNWQDIIPSKLNAGVVMIISPYDGSVLAQASAQYFLSRNWTVGFYLGEVLGNADTVKGSLPWSTSGVVQLVRYL